MHNVFLLITEGSKLKVYNFFAVLLYYGKVFFVFPVKPIFFERRSIIDWKSQRLTAYFGKLITALFGTSKPICLEIYVWRTTGDESS